MSEVFLCSICNVDNGGCKEDCAYCTQSLKYDTGVQIYREKSYEDILKEAEIFYKAGALGFCLVTSGRSLTPRKTEYIGKAAKMIKDAGYNFHLIACCGSADKESLRELKNSGVDSYNHNLETSQVFFPNICTTHTWEERYQTCENAASVGLMLCVGGILGIGESWEDRVEFYKAVNSLDPFTSNINFYMPHDALPIKKGIMQRAEALECIKLARSHLPNTRLMMAGGREAVFGAEQKDIFEAGINAIVIGGYLNAKGGEIERDKEMLSSYDLHIATACH
ncbi:MAG: biotin synthase [Campylobacteraceae bacterium]|jgi:biotin synthase|nr:biotin synthase [Campylobacteraceae bacterium]